MWSRLKHEQLQADLQQRNQDSKGGLNSEVQHLIA
jgi:hypothetical protein